MRSMILNLFHVEVFIQKMHIIKNVTAYVKTIY